jgi:hypothetical protein
MKISQLPSNSAPPATALLPVVTGGLTYQSPLSSLPVSDLTTTALAAKASLSALANTDGATLIGFSAGTTGVVASTVDNLFRERVSVWDYLSAAKRTNLLAGGFPEIKTEIQSCIDANPGKVIVLPAHPFSLNGTVYVQSQNTFIKGAGRNIYINQQLLDADSFVFKPTTAGTTADMLSNVGISGVYVSHNANSATHTAGAGIRFTQCSTWYCKDFLVLNTMEGITVEGGQLGSISHGTIFSSSGAMGGTSSAALHFKQAAIGGGSYQSMFTVEVSDLRISATKRNADIRIANSDGLHFSNLYLNNAGTSLVLFEQDRDASYISDVAFSNCYFDCNGGTSSYGVEFRNDGFTAPVYTAYFGSGCKFGGASISGLISRKPQLNDLNLTGAHFNVNTSWGVDIDGANSATKVAIVSCAFNSNGQVGVGGGAARLNNLQSGRFIGNSLGSNNTVGLLLTGVWANGVVSGNINNSNIADITNTATATGTLDFSGNTSLYNGLTANSWIGSNQLTAKTVPVDADTLSIWDSAASWIRKSLTIANLAAALLNGRAIGATSQSTGKFTTIETTGNMTLGFTPSATINFYNARSITGGTSAWGQLNQNTIQSGVTTGAAVYQSLPSTVASAFTLNTLYHFKAVQGTVGAGSAVTNQYGFYVDSTLTGASFNFGFRGELAAASGVWNIYMNGTAANYMNGATTFGTSFGYGTLSGVGGAVTQGTSRTTAVTLNKACGEITLFTAAGSATAASFTVNNSVVAATDQIILNVKSGTNKYITAVTAKGAGTFEITFWTTGGTASDAPVIGFTVIKSTNS